MKVFLGEGPVRYNVSVIFSQLSVRNSHHESSNFTTQPQITAMEVGSIDELGGGTGSDAIQPSVPPSANDILATIHLQERCFQRNIPSFQLDAAIKYGSRTESVTPNGNRCWKFNYGLCDRLWHEVWSYSIS